MTDIATMSVEITADAKQLDAALRRVEQQLKGFGRAVPPLGAPFERAVVPIQRAEAATLRFASARARLLRDQGNLAGAERVLQGALRQTTASTTQTINVERQLIAVRKQLEVSAGGAAASTRGLASSLSGLQGAFGALGISVGASALVQFGREAIGAANRLEDAQTSLRAIAGSADLYSKTMAVAAQNQRLFGGSLAENVEEMGSFVVSSRLAGVELDQLLDISQRLATLDPAQGARGAAIALRELLSGNTRSLAARFELPQTAIKAMGDESLSASEKLAHLGAFLDDVGISTETVRGRLDNTSQSYRDLSAAIDAATTSIGTLLAQGLAPAADEAAKFAQAIALAAQTINAGQGPLDALSGAVIANAASYEEYRAGLDQASTATAQFAQQSQIIQGIFGANAPAVMALVGPLLNLTTSMGALTPLQFEYAKALEATGVSAQAAAAAAAEQAGAFAALQTGIEQSQGALAPFGEAMAELVASNEENVGSLMQLIAAYNAGDISLAQFSLSIGALQTATEAAAAAKRDAAGATEELAAESEAAAAMLDFTANAAAAEEAALRTATVAAYEAADAGGDLEDQARAAAAALADAGPAGQRAAAQLAGSSAQVDILTAAFYRLEAAKRDALGGGGALGNLGGPQGIVKGAGEATAAIRALNRVYGAGPLGGKPPTGGRGGGGRGGGGGGTSAAAKAAEAEQKEAARLHERLLAIQARYHEQSVEAERDYQERVLAITQEYAAKRAAAERDFADDQFATRASFYRSLRGIEDEGQRQALAAEFEQEQLRAADIAATQGADVAAEYLSAITEILQARARRQAEIAQALKDGNKGDAEFLQGLDRLDREVEQRRIDAILAGKGSLEAQEAAELDEAAARRAEQLAQAQLTVQDDLAEAEGRKADAASITNEQLQRQLDLTREIARAGGVTPTAPATTASAGATATTTAALPAATPSTGPVDVRDADAIATMTQMISTLESLRRAFLAQPAHRPGV